MGNFVTITQALCEANLTTIQRILNNSDARRRETIYLLNCSFCFTTPNIYLDGFQRAKMVTELQFVQYLCIPIRNQWPAGTFHLTVNSSFVLLIRFCWYKDDGFISDVFVGLQKNKPISMSSIGVCVSEWCVKCGALGGSASYGCLTAVYVGS